MLVATTNLFEIAVQDNGSSSNQDVPFDNQKLRGGYYTPTELAEAISSWAIIKGDAVVLEPSAGDGQIVRSIQRRLNKNGQVVALEIVPDEAAKLASSVPQALVINSEFFSWFSVKQPLGLFDSVVANPPFLRHHNFPEIIRDKAFALMRQEGLNPNKRTDSWLPFLVAATQALRSGGRLAMILPASLLQVGYAQEVRDYLLKQYSQLTIVRFETSVFPELQLDAVVLFGIKGNSSQSDFKYLEIKSPKQLDKSVIDGPTHPAVKPKAGTRWLRYSLSPTEQAIYEEIEKSNLFQRLDAVAETNIGVVTGKNIYFVLTKNEAKQRGLLQWCRPAIGRVAQIPGLSLDESGWNALAEHGERCYLLVIPHFDSDLMPAAISDYVSYGESLKFHEGNKCSERLPNWWELRATWAPDAFLTRQIYEAPRIIINAAAAIPTDTILRIKANPATDIKSLSAAALNSATLISAELNGRVYGGGVLELSPTEAGSMLIPHLDANIDHSYVESILRDYGLESALDEMDHAVLKPLGLTDKDLGVLRGIWKQLSVRRKLPRKPRNSTNARNSSLR